MNIFFTGSIRGGRENQPKYALIVKALEKHGTVLSKHVSDDTFSEFGETNLSNSEILERELNALGRSDLVVAEVTTPSHGVGYMIARATSLGKKVIALHYGEYALKLSGIIQGDSGVKVHAYKTGEDIERILAEAFSDNKEI